MVTILFGDNTKESRQVLSSMLSQTKEYISFSHDSVTMTDLAQVLEGTSLFQESKTIYIENYLTKARKSNEKEAVLTFLQKHANDHEIILWEGKDLTKIHYKQFTKPTLRQFKLPQTIFAFLDELRPNNAKKTILLHHKARTTTEPELIFYMLVRHVRVLLALSDKTEASIDEVKRLAPWQRAKLEKQQQLFGQEKLLHLHNSLFAIESKQKVGALPMPLPVAIDFLLLAL